MRLRDFLVLGAGLYWIFFIVHTFSSQPVKPSVYPVRGKATWYTGRQTATGEMFAPAGDTCAMRRRDFGGHYRVCNVGNGRCVQVRHNDFGPSIFWYYIDKRIIDLSPAAFEQIADKKTGVIEVTVMQDKALSAPD